MLLFISGHYLILLLQAGCDEIWEKICSVQGKDPSVDFTQVLINGKLVGLSTFSPRTWLRTAKMIEALTRSQKQLLQLNCQQLSSPDLRYCKNFSEPSSQIYTDLSLNILNVQEISELVSSCLSSPLRREKLATAIENDNYIKKLLNIFTVCEVGAFCPVLFPLELMSQMCVAC